MINKNNVLKEDKMKNHYKDVEVTIITPANIIIEEEKNDFTPVKVTLKSDWCECDNHRFHSYPADGECNCGTHKHHVHCFCGSISQIG